MYDIIGISEFLSFFKHQAKGAVDVINSLYRQDATNKLLFYFYIANETIFRTKDRVF
jgi:hypothetical protein